MNTLAESNHDVHELVEAARSLVDAMNTVEGSKEYRNLFKANPPYSGPTYGTEKIRVELALQAFERKHPGHGTSAGAKAA